MASSKITAMVGKRFGRLTVLRSEVINRASGKRDQAVFCRCDCGTEKVIESYGVLKGLVLSCGCYKKERNCLPLKKLECQCGESNPINFYKRLRGICKKCIGLRVKKRAANHKAEIAAYRRRYRILGKDRLSRERWKAANLDKIRLYGRSCAAKRQAAMRQSSNEKVSYAAIIKRDGMKCHICLKKVARKDLSFDHLIPLSRGGSHTQKNIAVSHLICNVRRGAGRIPAQLLLVG